MGLIWSLLGLAVAIFLEVPSLVPKACRGLWEGASDTDYIKNKQISDIKKMICIASPGVDTDTASKV